MSIKWWICKHICIYPCSEILSNSKRWTADVFTSEPQKGLIIKKAVGYKNQIYFYLIYFISSISSFQKRKNSRSWLLWSEQRMSVNGLKEVSSRAIRYSKLNNDDGYATSNFTKIIRHKVLKLVKKLRRVKLGNK